ncbi:MAG: helix-turn-helix type 3 domain-containing protein [Halomonadaceae bacterium T82-2]|nr:MAG: helix-turn-helix type 3 domain-containing protein [Halomonadaceae bacterium T82-2]
MPEYQKELSELGRTLRRLRQKQGLTLVEVAEIVGSHVGNLSRIERGLSAPSFSLFYRLAKALGCRPADLFLLIDQADDDADMDELVARFTTLDADKRRLLIAFSRLLDRDAPSMQGDEQDLV